MANILITDDDEQLCLYLSTLVQRLGHDSRDVHTVSKARTLYSSENFDIVILDLELPDGNGLSILPEILNLPSAPEVIIITGTGNIHGAELAFKYGAWDFIPKPLDPNEVILSITRALQYRGEKLALRKPRLLKREGIVGNSPALNNCLELVAQSAATETGVLISGETGTGKELTARAIHANSARCQRPFVVVDCASLPESLLESALFGHEKGAFTGATACRPGLIRHAEGGTLFLDEVGEMPLSMQKAFLRVLQEKRYRPVGSDREMECDFRLVAATNRNLDQTVAQGEFRSDLLYRLRPISVHLPPLKDRRSDIPSLVMHYLNQFCSRSENHELKGCSPEFFKALNAYHWPGNVRELFNALDHALATVGDGPTLYQIHLPPRIRLPQLEGLLAEEKQRSQGISLKLNGGETLRPIREYRDAIVTKAEKEYLQELMLCTRGSIKTACEISGLSESRIHALLKKYNTPRFRKNRIIALAGTHI